MVMNDDRTISRPATRARRIGFGILDWAMAVTYVALAFFLVKYLDWWAPALLVPAALWFAANPSRGVQMYRLGYQRGKRDMLIAIGTDGGSATTHVPHPADEYPTHRAAA